GLPAPSILDAGGTSIMLLLRNLSANLGPFAAARRDGDALRFRCQSLPAGNYTIVWGAERRPATITSGGDTTVEFDGP
ncbi:MAG TPA: hypothetical protein PKG80_06815, partial [Acidobacteriota bacterium]|nr:hypothetical protein [Acidobacteriota bacterium]